MSKATFRSAFIELNRVYDEGWKARLVSSLGRIATKWALLPTAWASNCTYCLVSLGRPPYPADIPGKYVFQVGCEIWSHNLCRQPGSPGASEAFARSKTDLEKPHLYIRPLLQMNAINESHLARAQGQDYR